MGRRFFKLTPVVLAAALLAPQLAAYEQEIGRLASAMAEKISGTGKTRIAVSISRTCKAGLPSWVDSWRRSSRSPWLAPIRGSA